MKHGMPWYKHNVHEFLDGVQGIGADTIGAYIVLLDLIYARGGETRRDDRHLAAVLGSSKRLATALTDRLIELGKIEVHGAFITNSRAKNEVKSARTVAERRVNGQRTRRENETSSNENSELENKNVSLKPPREEKIREDNTSSLHSEVSAPAKPTPRQELLKVLDADRAEAVIEHRQRIRKPITAHAAKLLAGKLSKWHDANEAADAMISNGWQGFEVEWMSRARGSPAGGGKSAFRQHQDEVTQSFRDALKGTEYDQSPRDDRQGQPSFDLESGDFFSDRTATAGKR